jgi:methyl-accepting chemotaxis protein
MTTSITHNDNSTNWHQQTNSPQQRQPATARARKTAQDTRKQMRTLRTNTKQTEASAKRRAESAKRSVTNSCEISQILQNFMKILRMKF